MKQDLEVLELSPGEGLGTVKVSFTEPTIKDLLELSYHKQTAEEESVWGCVLMLEVDGKKQSIEWWAERPVKGFYNPCVKLLTDGIQSLKEEGTEKPADPLA